MGNPRSLKALAEWYEAKTQRREAKKEKPNKYGAKRLNHAGMSFASQLEAAIYDHLKLLERAGEIELVNCQDHIKLTPAEILYIPDFKILEVRTQKFVWVEAKGLELPEFKIKKRLWKFFGPGELHIYKGSANRFKLHEVVIPVVKTDE